MHHNYIQNVNIYIMKLKIIDENILRLQLCIIYDYNSKLKLISNR